MTNQQLKLLLDGLLAEFSYALEDAEDMMPDGAERIPRAVLVYRDSGEPVGSIDDPYGSRIMFGEIVRGNIRTTTEEHPTGSFVALKPLVDLLDGWRERFESLETVSPP